MNSGLLKGLGRPTDPAASNLSGSRVLREDGVLDLPGPVTLWSGDFGIPVGNYMRVPQISASNQNGGLATTIGQIIVWRFTILQTAVITKMGVGLWATSSAGGVVRFGLWKPLASGYPGALIVDAGTITTVGTNFTLIAATLNAPITLRPGSYYTGAVAQGSPSTVPTFITQDAAGVTGSLVTSTNGADKVIGGYKLTSVGGALPNPFTSGGTAITSGTGSTNGAVVYLGG